MAKPPKYWPVAEVELESGLYGDWAVDRVMDVTDCTRAEALDALEYAKAQGAGKRFDKYRIPPG